VLRKCIPHRIKIRNGRVYIVGLLSLSYISVGRLCTFVRFTLISGGLIVQCSIVLNNFFFYLVGSLSYKSWRRAPGTRGRLCLIFIRLTVRSGEPSAESEKLGET
jgi:hypothetical protein